MPTSIEVTVYFSQEQESIYQWETTLDQCDPLSMANKVCATGLVPDEAIPVDYLILRDDRPDDQLTEGKLFLESF
ncbi:hypothetical protein [Neptuniibacter sp. QD37_11]|uniref:hypothetical protein n=1 Tax=Neptuniibacter sp. QD37_11 TaxID=3398209 RepID=UPI0039F46F68